MYVTFKYYKLIIINITISRMTYIIKADKIFETICLNLLAQSNEIKIVYNNVLENVINSNNYRYNGIIDKIVNQQF